MDFICVQAFGSIFLVKVSFKTNLALFPDGRRFGFHLSTVVEASLESHFLGTFPPEAAEAAEAALPWSSQPGSQMPLGKFINCQ